MKNSLVSIIIPTYNRAHLIGETLDSIIAQTYENWECIVVDDGSTDATKSIVLQYQESDTRISFYQRPSHQTKGANACRNYGLEKSTGEYVHWFDSDDLMHPEKIKKKVDFALKFSSDVVLDDHFNDKTKLSSAPLESNNCYPKIFYSSNFYLNLILGEINLITNDVMLKSSCIKSARFDERLHKGQEFEFLVRVFNQPLNYCITSLKLTYYRDTEDSISSNSAFLNKNKQKSLILINTILQESFPSNNKIQERAKKHLRKVYRNMIKQRKIFWVIENYKIFKNAFEMGYFRFSFFVIFNFFCKRGFDQMKP